MITVRKDSNYVRVTKNVDVLENGTIKYESFMFLWPEAHGAFRFIYRNFGNCTAWKLNPETGLWGCFADSNDIGFDRKTISVSPFGVESKTAKPQKHQISLKQELPPTQSEILEKIEDEVADAFFAKMREHTSKLFLVP